MTQQFHKHIGYYIGLGVVLLLGLPLLALTGFDKAFQMSVMVLLAFFYVLWGLLHHHMHHDLHTKIVLEYIVMAALGVSIVFFVIG